MTEHLLLQLECQRVREVRALLREVSGLKDKLAASQLYTQSLEQEVSTLRHQNRAMSPDDRHHAEKGVLRESSARLEVRCRGRTCINAPSDVSACSRDLAIWPSGHSMT